MDANTVCITYVQMVIKCRSPLKILFDLCSVFVIEASCLMVKLHAAIINVVNVNIMLKFSLGFSYLNGCLIRVF